MSWKAKSSFVTYASEALWARLLSVVVLSGVSAALYGGSRLEGSREPLFGQW